MQQKPHSTRHIRNEGNKAASIMISEHMMSHLKHCIQAQRIEVPLDTLVIHATGQKWCQSEQVQSHWI